MIYSRYTGSKLPSIPTQPSTPSAPLRPLSRLTRQENVTEHGELSGVFGSRIGESWNCITCKRKFKQEETIYPHPDAKLDTELKDVYFCRGCFSESFSKGNCKKCRSAVLGDEKFIIHGDNLWHEEGCYSCSYCSVSFDTPIFCFISNIKLIASFLPIGSSRSFRYSYRFLRITFL